MRRPIENLDPDDPRVVAARAARAVLGSGQVLAEQIGMKRQAVSGWLIVPAERVLAVEAATGISPHDLRPDVFGPSTKPSRICKALGVTLAEIAGWDRVPAEFVLKIEQLTGARVPVPARTRNPSEPRRPRGRPRKAKAQDLETTT